MGSIPRKFFIDRHGISGNTRSRRLSNSILWDLSSYLKKIPTNILQLEIESEMSEILHGHPSATPYPSSCKLSNLSNPTYQLSWLAYACLVRLGKPMKLIESVQLIKSNDSIGSVCPTGWSIRLGQSVWLGQSAHVIQSDQVGLIGLAWS